MKRRRIGNTGKYLGKLFLMSILGVSLLLPFLATESQGQSDVAPVPRQASGKLVFGPFEFRAPEGYWYFPRDYPEQGLPEGRTFVMTFFQTRQDIPAKGDGKDRFPEKPILNFFFLSTPFKDFRSYYDAVTGARRSRGVPEGEISYRGLPSATAALFREMANWDCREETIRGDRPFFGVNCVLLSDMGVIQISAHGQDEEDVMKRSPLLKEMMLSLRIGKPAMR